MRKNNIKSDRKIRNTKSDRNQNKIKKLHLSNPIRTQGALDGATLLPPSQMEASHFLDLANPRFFPVDPFKQSIHWSDLSSTKETHLFATVGLGCVFHIQRFVINFMRQGFHMRFLYIVVIGLGFMIKEFWFSAIRLWFHHTGFSRVGRERTTRPST